MKRLFLLFSLLTIMSSAMYADPYILVETPYVFGRSGTQSLTISASDLTEDIVYQISGPDASAYSLSTSYSWKPRLGGYLIVSFDPPESRIFRATLTISSSGIVKTIDLLGFKPFASPGTLNFGETEMNTTSAPLIVTSMGFGSPPTMSGGDISAFTVTEGTYNPQTGLRTWNVTFTPTQAKAYAAYLSFSSITYPSLLVSLIGTGVNHQVSPPTSPTPTLSINAGTPNVEFGRRLINLIHQDNIIVRGTDLTESISYTISGPDAVAFSASPSPLGTGWSNTSGGIMSIEFNPTQSRSYTATLTISSPGAESKTIALLGSGYSSTPVLKFNLMTTSDFNDVLINTTSTDRVIGISGTDLTGNISYTIGGSDASAFSIRESSWSSAGGGTLIVKFNPTEERSYSAYITASSPGAQDLRIDLTGNGISYNSGMPSTMNLQDTVIYFPVNRRLNYAQVTASNLSGPITYALSGPDANKFGFYAEPGWDPLKGGTISILHIPTDENRNFYATLTFSAPGVPSKAISLIGLVDAANPTSTPTPIIELINLTNTPDENKAEINTTSVNQTITVGGVDLTSNISYEIEGADAEAFSISINEASWNPATGGELTVLFSPKEERTYNAKLKIYSDGVEPQVITLTGEGKAMKSSTAIDNISPETVRVYPNPATDRITIETSGQNTGKAIEIYSVTGVMVSRCTIKGPVTTVDLASFAKGTYVIRINGKAVKIVKI